MGVIRVKRSGTWAPARGLYVKQSGAWVSAQKAFIKKNGLWEQIYPCPEGILTIVPSSVTLTAYNNFDSATATRLTLTNTGNDDILINTISVTQSSDFTTKINYTGVNGQTQNIVLAQGQSKYIDVFITGNKGQISTSISHIDFNYSIGVLGSASTRIPVTGTILANYSTISVSPSSVSYTTYQDGPLPSQNITISNNGNGGVLTISSITSASGITGISGVPSSIASGQSATFKITAPSGRTAGTHGDTIYVNTNLGTTNIPVQFTVLSTGAIDYVNPGTYSWTVPFGVTTITAAVQGAGGGGGGSTEVGDGAGGGGGGSGGYVSNSISVVPGEIITIVVGRGGAGAPALGRDINALGDEGPGKDGGASSVQALSGTLIATGGGGGTSGRTTTTKYGPGYGGGGGIGGSPGGLPGISGWSGVNDYSSTDGGAGGASYHSPGGMNGTASGNPTGGPGSNGSGGGGAGAPDRQSPNCWAGGNGGNGSIRISW